MHFYPHLNRILRENGQSCTWFGHSLVIPFGHAAPYHVQESGGVKSADDKSTGPWFLTDSFGFLSRCCHDLLLWGPPSSKQDITR